MDSIKTKRGYKFVSIVLTTIIVGMLLLSGPARAITLGITDVTDSTPNESSTVSFLAKLDLHTDDRVPLTNITVNIKYTNGSVADTCTFDLDGTEIPACSTFTISDLSSSSGRSYSAVTSGLGFGYGYNDTNGWGNINHSFDYGYARVLGYGYNSFNESVSTGAGGATAEFIYNITWTTPAVAANTAFDIEFYALANDGTSDAKFQTKTDSQITVVNVASTPTTNAGGGSSNTIAVTETQIQEGVQKKLYTGQRLQFTIGGGSHSLTLGGVSDGKVTITVASTPQTAVLALGEQKKFELTGDNYYDLSVKVDAIVGNRADLTIKTISEAISTSAEEPVETPSDGTGVGTPTETPEETARRISEEQQKSQAVQWLVAILIVAAIAVAVVFFLKGQKKSKRRKKLFEFSAI